MILAKDAAVEAYPPPLLVTGYCAAYGAVLQPRPIDAEAFDRLASTQSARPTRGKTRSSRQISAAAAHAICGMSGCSEWAQRVGPDSPNTTPPGARTTPIRTPGITSCGSATDSAPAAGAAL